MIIVSNRKAGPFCSSPPRLTHACVPSRFVDPMVDREHMSLLSVRAAVDESSSVTVGKRAGLDIFGCFACLYARLCDVCEWLFKKSLVAFLSFSLCILLTCGCVRDNHECSRLPSPKKRLLHAYTCMRHVASLPSVSKPKHYPSHLHAFPPRPGRRT